MLNQPSQPTLTQVRGSSDKPHLQAENLQQMPNTTLLSSWKSHWNQIQNQKKQQQVFNQNSSLDYQTHKHIWILFKLTFNIA